MWINTICKSCVRYKKINHLSTIILLLHNSKNLEQRLVDSVPSSKYTELESSLGLEVKRLKQQLKWYMENQQLIENNVELVQQKDKEITTLKEKLSKKVRKIILYCYTVTSL